MDEGQQQINKLFYKVIHSKVLFKQIIKHVKLYNRNRWVKFYYRNNLILYKEREYIHKIIYMGTEMLEKGDLPVGNILKEVEFRSIHMSLIKGDVIPNGVEIIEYCGDINGFYCVYDNKPTTPFSTLPPSIKTIKNASINENNLVGYNIPSNIESISFMKCPNLSGNGDVFITIPDTVRSLELPIHWNNEDVPLRIGDIPNSITNLIMRGYKIKGLLKGAIPNSIRSLEIDIGDSSGNEKYSDGLFDPFPSNIENLYILCYCNITPLSNFISLITIKKLTINFNLTGIKRISRINKIMPNSLPPSITELNLIDVQFQLEPEVIPQSVEKLELSFRACKLSIGIIPNSIRSLKLKNIVTEDGIFPQFLTHFEYSENSSGLITHSKETFMKMITLLPTSLSSITLPKGYKKYSIKLPLSINKIQYK